MKAEHVARVGDITITRVGEYLQVRDVGVFYEDADRLGGVLAGEEWLRPYCTADRQLLVMIQAFVVDTPEAVILLDPCIGDDRTRQRLFHDKPAHTTFLDDLEDAVGDLRRVDVVAFTHLHLDHVGWSTTRSGDGWTPTFPWARHVVAGPEWEHWRHEAEVGAANDFTWAIDESIRPLFDEGLVDLVDANHALATGLRFRDTSGHSAGHVSLEIESNGQRALITGDVFHHPVEVHDPGCRKRTGLDLDPGRALAARVDLVEDLTDTDTLMIGTHFPGCCAGYVERGARGRHRFRALDQPADRAPGAG
jgi:glyoxylase-like metal-dependent hydrolase (beta-lactamase superfamily II)